MSDVVLEDVHKSYGTTTAAAGVSLSLQPGEFVTLLGPSGCGKTTCLRMVAGFVEPDQGRILIGGKDVTRVPTYRRNTGMVFQSYALFPHKTVAQNVAFGMKVRGVKRGEMAERTLDALRLVRLEHLAERYPSQLSGGQKQRVALARAVVFRPSILLLDEPLAALDLKLREELQVEIKAVQSALQMTTLFVTHDQGEALGMSDRIAVMQDGRIVQVDTPQVLYERPASRYVANFVGRTNLIEVEVKGRDADGSYTVASLDSTPDTYKVSGDQHVSLQTGERCLLATRPEHLALGESNGVNKITAKVVDLTFRGSFWTADLTGPRGEALSAQFVPGAAVPRKGDTVTACWTPSRSFLLKQDT